LLRPSGQVLNKKIHAIMIQKPKAELEKLWLQFGAELSAFIRSRVPQKETAEDILQDVFVRIHAGLAGLRDQGRMESWIYQIARNAVADYYRSRRYDAGITEDLPIEDNSDSEENASERLIPAVRGLVEALQEPYREALILTSYQGLSQKELADRSGISFSGAKSRVQRARQMIRDALLACCHFEFDSRGKMLDFYEHFCCCAGR